MGRQIIEFAAILKVSNSDPPPPRLVIGINFLLQNPKCCLFKTNTSGMP
jgi:hypothetical protein